MASPVVYIVDDDPDVRDSLEWLVKSVGIECRTYATAREFLDVFTDDVPGCLVFDVRMPDTSGLDLFEQCIQLGHKMPVIFVTAYADVPMAVRAMKSGAVEFVEKPFNRQTLLERIQRAIRSDAQRRERDFSHAEVTERFRRLTEKEREVIRLIGAGLPNKSIATQLGITQRAVEMRRANVMKKLNVHSLAELLRLAIQFELLSDEPT